MFNKKHWRKISYHYEQKDKWYLVLVAYKIMCCESEWKTIGCIEDC
jgi:hypothetical protein